MIRHAAKLTAAVLLVVMTASAAQAQRVSAHPPRYNRATGRLETWRNGAFRPQPPSNPSHRISQILLPRSYDIPTTYVKPQPQPRRSVAPAFHINQVRSGIQSGLHDTSRRISSTRYFGNQSRYPVSAARSGIYTRNRGAIQYPASRNRHKSVRVIRMPAR